MLERDFSKKSFDEYLIKFYINYIGNGVNRNNNSINENNKLDNDKIRIKNNQIIKVKNNKFKVNNNLNENNNITNIKNNRLHKVPLTEKLEDSSDKDIERKIQKEINRAIERIGEDLESEVTAENSQWWVDTNGEQEIRIRYATEERLEVNYGEIFSYLNTRPNLIKYEYEFVEKKEGAGEAPIYNKVEKINKIKRLEKALYQRDLKDEIPEGITAREFEEFKIYSKTLQGFVMNIFYYDSAFLS